ncbi:phosphatase PAP2 family protein [Sporomusa malonica]|uniref:PAP2 superfamily protein n=1 Tax=Sporomusa malonica TaxID=112901 RepID=A0A1W2DQD0_9FIRM|nr:phosphatase PAP2 family protein [Sporomusa malonica]SMC99609.1 PAP2 superfamily protein [Sporomusa malonica]
MKAGYPALNHKGSFSKALEIAIVVGVITSIVVLTMQRSQNDTIWLVGEFLSSTGNDLFLVFSNLLIIGWAWRKKLMSVIKLTLLLDLSVWIFVQGIKLIQIDPWYLRPNGGTGGFPSGHATHAFAMAFLLTLYFPRLAWLWYACAAGISWSRVETEWHTGFQVIAGIALGTGLVWVLVTRWLTHPDAAMIKLHSPEIQQSRKIQGQQAYVAE